MPQANSHEWKLTRPPLSLGTPLHTTRRAKALARTGNLRIWTHSSGRGKSSNNRTATLTLLSAANSTIHSREIPMLIMKSAAATGCKEEVERSQFHHSRIIEWSLKCKQIQLPWEVLLITSPRDLRTSRWVDLSIEHQPLMRWQLEAPSRPPSSLTRSYLNLMRSISTSCKKTQTSKSDGFLMQFTWESWLRESVMAKVWWNMQIADSMRDCGKKTCETAKDSRDIPTEIRTLAISKWAKPMVRECILG